MAFANPRQRRISLQSDTVGADLALPADVPIAELLPAIVDLLAVNGSGPDRTVPYRLGRPASAALDGSKTLAQQAVQDGDLLLLTSALNELPAPRFTDPVDRVATTVREIARPWTARAAQQAAGVGAIGLAAVAGFVAVPGGPGAPNALLAGVAAVVAAVLAMQPESTWPTPLACCALAALVALAALATMVTGAAPSAIAATATAGGLGLLHSTARLVAVCTGLSRCATPAPDVSDGRIATAHHLVTALIAASSAVVAMGAVATTVAVHASANPHFGGAALAAVGGAALLLRARHHIDRSRIDVLLAGGLTALAAALTAAAAEAPQRGLWLAAVAAAAAGAALYLGRRPTLSPVTIRVIELAEYPVLAAVAPLVCWICGCYGAVRGLNLA